MTATSLIAYTQQYNNSTATVSQNGLMQAFSPYGGTQYNQPIFVAEHYYNNTARNRKERRAAEHKQHNQQKAKKVTIDDEVERISNTIDKEILGIKNDGNCCCNFLDRMVRRGTGYWSLSGFGGEASIMRLLQQIDEYMQESSHQGANLMKLLEKKNGVFSRLIASVMWYKEEQGITGSTIDGFLDHGCIFPQLSPSLAKYIGTKLSWILFVPAHQRHSGNSPQSPSVKAYFSQGEKYIDLSSLCTYKKSPDIHSIALTGHRYPIDEDSIMVSHDNKYIKATDIPCPFDFEDSTTIIWDMVTGQRCDDVEEEGIVWKEKELYEKNASTVGTIQFCQSNTKEQYHVSLCNTYHVFGSGCVSEKKQPALYLYKRPTWISDLCQTTFYKNRRNNDELDALLNSNMVQKKLTGFPQKNLIHAIQQAQEKNEADERTCL